MPRAWAAAVGAVCALAAFPRSSLPQTTATLDVGASTVQYDGFLTSFAAAFAPSVRWVRRGTTLSAQGTYLRFQSGNNSIQGTVTGSTFTSGEQRWRGQVLATAGASRYADFAKFGHAIVEARIHYFGNRRGAWLGGTLGRASLGDGAHSVTGEVVAVWLERGGVQWFASATHAHVGDTAYTDLEGAARARRGSAILEGYAGARIWSRGGGHGVYGEGSATFQLSTRLNLVVSGGRYPTDPIRGNISGRYASIALRLQSQPTPRPIVSRLSASLPHSEPSLQVDVLPDGDRAVRLTVIAPEAGLVELAGDFTDWQPVTLERAATGEWEGTFRVLSGLHRMTVRVDGGRWLVPHGTTRVADDFDGEVGLFLVP